MVPKHLHSYSKISLVKFHLVSDLQIPLFITMEICALVLVLLTLHAERFFVSRMRDFFWYNTKEKLPQQKKLDFIHTFFNAHLVYQNICDTYFNKITHYCTLDDWVSAILEEMEELKIHFDEFDIKIISCLSQKY